MARPWVREYFPWPLVGAVVLLVVLIFLTPNLLSSANPAAGSLVTEAELIVDRVLGSNVTHFYVEGLGNVRYAEIRAGVDPNVSWPPPPSATNLTFTNLSNGTNVLALAFNSPANPVAVNVTVLYVDQSGGTVEYWGIYAFNTSAGYLNVGALDPLLPTYPPTPVGSLPLTILLSSGVPGTVP